MLGLALVDRVCSSVVPGIRHARRFGALGCLLSLGIVILDSTPHLLVPLMAMDLLPASLLRYGLMFFFLQ